MRALESLERDLSPGVEVEVARVAKQRDQTLEAVEVNTAERLWTGAMDLGADQLRRLMTGG